MDEDDRAQVENSGEREAKPQAMAILGGGLAAILG
jgi:hypothetical protein